MATIGEIRKRSGLVIILIGLAMLGFIATDLLSSNSFLLSDRITSVGEIWGEEINPNVYSEQIEMSLSNERANLQPGESINPMTEAQIHEQVWNQIVLEQILQREANALGLEVTGEEIMHLVLGPDPHPIAQQYMADPKTGQIDRAQMANILNNITQQTPELQEQWFRLEQYMSEQRLQEKYVSLLNNGIYVTDLEAEDDFFAKNKTIDFEYVPLFTSSIADSTVEVSDAYMREVYEENKEDYKQETTREFQYVFFQVTPEAQDTAASLNWIEKQTDAFRRTKNDSNFVVRVGSGTFSNKYEPRGTYPESIEDQIFAADTGTILGPFFEDGRYKLVKVLGSKQDSITYYRASHILIRPKGATEADSTEAYNEAKKLYDQARGGADFAQLARENSQDVSNAFKGGDLGWFSEGRMVKRFEDAVKRTSEGGLALVRTEFGTHVIKVTEAPSRKLVKAAILERPVRAGRETEDKAYASAVKFRTQVDDYESFINVAKEMGINPRVADNIRPNDRVAPGIESAREIVRWAYDDEREIGDVSDPRRLGDKYVVAVITKMNEEGYKPLEEVEEEVKNLAIQKKKKEMLNEKLQNAMSGKSDLEAIAKEVGSAVNKSMGVTFSNDNITNLSSEPKLVGYLSGLDPNKIAGPVEGNNGVFVVKVTNINTVDAPEDFTNQQALLRRQAKSPAWNQATEALKEKADIKDNRYIFY